MKSNSIGKYFCGAVVALTAVSSVYADGKRDFYIQQAESRFFNTPTTSRNVGMGQSLGVTSSESLSAITNPAGLGMQRGGDVTASYGLNEVSGNELVSYAEIENEIQSGQVLASIPLVPSSDSSAFFGNLGLGWTGIEGDADDHIDSQTRGNQVHAAYGIAVSDVTSLGYGLTWVKNKQYAGDVYSQDMDNGFKHIFGLQQIVGDTVVGLSFFFADGDGDVNNGLGQRIGKSDVHQHGVELGSAYNLGDALATFAVDYTKFDVDGFLTDANTASFPTTVGGNESGHFFSVKLGVEQALADWLVARLGYRYEGREQYFFGREDLRGLNGSAKTNVYAAGLGLVIPTGGHYVKNVNLDYAAEYREIAYGDWMHMISLSVPFDLCEPM